MLLTVRKQGRNHKVRGRRGATGSGVTRNSGGDEVVNMLAVLRWSAAVLSGRFCFPTISLGGSVFQPFRCLQLAAAPSD